MVAFVIVLALVVMVVLVLAYAIGVDAIGDWARRRIQPEFTSERERIRYEAKQAMHDLRRDSDAEKADAGPLNDKGELADNEAAALRWGYGLHKGGGTLP